MKKLKKVLFSPVITVLAFVLAAGLLAFSSVGGARAALTYYSENYSTQVQMFDIGVTLVENGEDVSWRNYDSGTRNGNWIEVPGRLLKNDFPEERQEDAPKLVIGKPYKEELCVRNSGTINQYVRVSIFRYWVDSDGNKQQELDPSLIDLHLVNLDSAWILDDKATTTERTVLYYNRLLNTGNTTPLFADTLTIDNKVATFKSASTKDGKTVVVYDYNGMEFCLEAKVDAVQENNAEAAILSAWGREVAIDGTSLSLR